MADDRAMLQALGDPMITAIAEHASSHKNADDLPSHSIWKCPLVGPYVRAFRACVEALEGDKEEFETLLDGHVDDVSFAAVEQRLTAIRTALALAQAADSPTTEAEA
jgi:hypothetical protein